MDDADIYYVDARNADGRDHRKPGSSSSSGSSVPWRPMGPPPPVSTVYVPPQAQPMYQQPLYQPATAPMIYTVPQQSAAATLLGRLTTGDVIQMVAQIFAALQALPAAPVATRAPDVDVANHILYQTALAQHAKRDEQVRTIGALVAKLVG